MRPALTAAGKRRWQESSGDLNRFGRVEVYVHATAGRPAAQQADVLAVGPVGRCLLLGDPQRFPPGASWVLLAVGDRDYGRPATDEGGGSAPAFLRAHAAVPSGPKSLLATSMAATIAASGARLCVYPSRKRVLCNSHASRRRASGLWL